MARSLALGTPPAHKEKAPTRGPRKCTYHLIGFALDHLAGHPADRLGRAFGSAAVAAGHHLVGHHHLVGRLADFAVTFERLLILGSHSRANYSKSGPSGEGRAGFLFEPLWKSAERSAAI